MSLPLLWYVTLNHLNDLPGKMSQAFPVIPIHLEISSHAADQHILQKDVGGWFRGLCGQITSFNVVRSPNSPAVAAHWEGTVLLRSTQTAGNQIAAPVSLWQKQTIKHLERDNSRLGLFFAIKLRLKMTTPSGVLFAVLRHAAVLVVARQLSLWMAGQACLCVKCLCLS